jgi:hypothetical protein
MRSTSVQVAERHKISTEILGEKYYHPMSIEPGLARLLTTFACTILTEGAPSLRSLQGWAAMLRVLFDLVVDA